MAEQPKNAPEAEDAVRKALVRVIGAWIVLPLFFLVTGGSLDWWEAWAWCVVVLVPMTVFLSWIARRDPEFLARRMKMREKERTQRWVLALGWPSFLGTILVPGLDHRFGWSEPPTAAVAAALAITLAGYLWVLRVFHENRWAGRTIETSEGQEVISTGPYALMRHPMYTGTLLLYLATPVALGSWWAVLPALGLIPVIVLRILNEERVLVRELRGYEGYQQRVRCRLIPLIW